MYMYTYSCLNSLPIAQFVSELTSSPGEGLASEGFRAELGEDRGEFERVGEPPPDIAATDADGAVAEVEGAAEDEEDDDDSDDDETFLGNFKLAAFLLMLDKGLRKEPTCQGKCNSLFRCDVSICSGKCSNILYLLTTRVRSLELRVNSPSVRKRMMWLTV